MLNKTFSFILYNTIRFYYDFSIFLILRSNSTLGIPNDFLCFYLGITNDLTGIAVNSRFPVLLLIRLDIRLVVIYFATALCGGWIKLNRACKSAGREPLIIDIAFPRQRRGGNSSDRS